MFKLILFIVSCGFLIYGWFNQQYMVELNLFTLIALYGFVLGLGWGIGLEIS